MFLEFRKRFRRRIRRRASAAAQFDFPELITQRIQSFLTTKEAARTTLLSKSWRSAWLTRPNLDFDLTDFRRYHFYHQQFYEFAGKTLDRYGNFNLKIQSFRLSMYHPQGIATRLVCRALKLGPTHLTFKFDALKSDFDIPDEVFRHENLVSLTAKRCGINLNLDEVCCSRLQFLSLEYVKIQCPDTIFHISKSCPLIEKLSLCHLEYNVGDCNLLQTINLHRLKSLVLKEVNFDIGFLADSSFRFPSLKDLTLSIMSKDRIRNQYISKDRETILISSTTLEHLDINMRRHNHRVKLDIPSIRKLTFGCTSIPKLSVRSNSKGWESHVSVTRRKCLSASWFYKLNNFLNKLRFSRISLSLHVYSQITFHYEPGDIKVLPTPEIENLDIYHEHLPTQSCYVLFDGLFRMCRPKVIAPYTSDENWDTNTIRFLEKRLLEARDSKDPMANYHFMYGLNDLKEVRVQVFDEDFYEWHDVTLESLLDEYSTIYNEEGYDPYIRFLLNWKQ